MVIAQVAGFPNGLILPCNVVVALSAYLAGYCFSTRRGVEILFLQKVRIDRSAQHDLRFTFAYSAGEPPDTPFFHGPVGFYTA